MKKAIELSLNFLVTIIIALVIFGFGVKFIYDIASNSENLKDITIEDLDKRIEDLVCESTDKVCIPTTNQVIRRGKFDVFGVKIINVVDEQDFQLVVTPIGYTVNNGPIQNDNLDEKIDTLYDEGFFSIDRNEEVNKGIGVEIRKKAPSGTYILNVEVNDANGEYDELYKIRVTVP